MLPKFTQKNTNRGFTVLLSLLVTGIVLAVGVAIVNITLKQYQISGMARESEIAFHAAYAGVECMRYYDLNEATLGDPNTNFEIGESPDTINCFGVNDTPSIALITQGGEQQYEFEWDQGGKTLCTNVSIYKYVGNGSSDTGFNADGTEYGPCPDGAECTILKARGYNTSCSTVNGTISGLRVIEREVTFVY